MVELSARCVGIYWNSTKPSGLEVARELIGKLRTRGVRVCVDSELSAALGDPAVLTDAFGSCRLMIVLGGDGTILSSLEKAIPNDLPILGVNLGRLGFLTELEVGELDDLLLDRVLAEDYALDERVTLCLEGHDSVSTFALNDIAITREMAGVRVLSLEYEADGALLDRICADGLIVATATGSTAYSLSAGGPIVMPGLDCFVITPICPHTLNARPIVVPSGSRITVRLVDERGTAQAVLDGRKKLSMTLNDPEITICRSDRPARFVRLREKNYFALLRSKLSEWTH